jgi:phage baseplate assembly protein gpV
MRKGILTTTATTLIFIFVVASAHGQVISEGFESGLPTAWTTGTANLGSGLWSGTQFQMESSNIHSGTYACQIRSQTSSEITTPNIATGGVGTLTLWAAKSTAGTNAALQVRISVGGGAYTQLGSTLALSQYTFTEFSIQIDNSSDNIKLQFYRTDGTVYIDDVEITAFGISPEPSNQVTDFAATTFSPSRINLSWTNATGAQAPHGYLIKGSTGAITPPVDGTDPVSDPDLSDGNAVVKVAHGAKGTYSFTGLNSSTSYNFQVWSYTNTDNVIDFLLDPAGPTGNATTDYQAQAGDVIVTEVMYHPSGDDFRKEWFEVYNTSAQTVNMNEWIITDDETDTHTIDYGGPFYILPGEYMVFGRNDDTSLNGDVDLDYEYGTFFLSNDGDEIVLSNVAKGEIDRIAYNPGVVWPDPKEGTAIALDPDNLNATDNNNGAHWQEAIENFGDGDRGTPGHGVGGYTIWTGGNGTNWNDAGNWNDGIPTATSYVYIPAGLTNYPSITTLAQCSAMLLAKNATLALTSNELTILGSVIISGDETVEDSNKLTVGGSLSIYGSLTLKPGGMTTVAGACAIYGTMNVQASSTKSGSFITNGGVVNYGTTNVQRYIPAGFTKADPDPGWYFLSSPVANQTISKKFVDVTATPISSSVEFYYWNEVHDIWINIKADNGNYNTGTGWQYFSADANPTFETGKGYLISYNSNQTKTFTGSPNTGDFATGAGAPALTKTSGGTFEGWNMLGNPYPSGLDWDQGNWNKNNINGSVYIYRGSDGNYISWNGSTGDLTDGEIPVGSAFFVKAETTSSSLTIPNEARVHHINAPYKQGDVLAENVLVLQAEHENSSDRVYLQFTDQATMDYDMAVDAYKIMGWGNAPQIYSTSTDGIELSINALPAITEEMSIPINLKVINPGLHTISVFDQSLTEDVVALFEDTFENMIIDLGAEDHYTFVASTDDDPNRFILHLGLKSNISSTEGKHAIQIYSSGNQIYFNSVEQQNAIVKIYSLTGQLIYNKTLIINGLTNIELGNQKGWYVVKMLINENSFGKKIFLY